MTVQLVAHQTEIQMPEPADVELTPASPGNQASADAPSRQTDGARATAALPNPMLGVVRAASSIGSGLRRGAIGVWARTPRVLSATGASARWAVGALECVPDGTLRSLAATSVGFGAGLSFTRAGRLGALAGAVPAVVMGAVMVVRPRNADPQSGTSR